jgi:hypothetical protein
MNVLMQLRKLLLVLAFAGVALVAQADTGIFVGWFEVEGEGAPYSEFKFSLTDDDVISAQIETPIGGVFDLEYDDWDDYEWEFDHEEATMPELDVVFPSGNYLLTIVRSGGVTSEIPFAVGADFEAPNAMPEITAPLNGATDVAWPNATLQWTQVVSPNFNVIHIEEDEETFEDHVFDESTLDSYEMTGLEAGMAYEVSVGFANYQVQDLGGDVELELVRARYSVISFTTGWFEVPERSIVIDGDFSDWADIGACLVYQAEEGHVRSIYVARNATHFFYRFDLDGPMQTQPDSQFQYKMGHGRVHVNLGVDGAGGETLHWANGPEYPSVDWPNSELNFAVSSAGDRFEASVPLNRINVSSDNGWFAPNSIRAWTHDHVTDEIDFYENLCALNIASAFANAFNGGNNLKYLDWFGWYNDEYWPWIWDYEYGCWLWVVDNGPENVWFWCDNGQTWMWTRTDWYNWVWYPGNPGLSWRAQ